MRCVQQPVSIDMQRTVRAGGETYDVILGTGVWQRLGALLRERLPQSSSAAIVSDETVGPLYAPAIAASLRAAGFATSLITMPAAERAKTLETVSALYDQFVDAQLERSSVVLPLGGGLMGA